ncbi:MAG: ATP-binding protein [Sulfolobales archaeon]
MENETYEFRDGLLVYKEGSKVCLKRVTKVTSVSTAIQDLDDFTSIKYIKAYINAFNLGFPLEFHTFIKPVDRLAFVKNLERVIAENTVAYEVNPFKADSRIKAERAKYIRSRILKDSLQPFETEVYIAVTACGVDFESSLEVLKARMRVLRSTLNTLGVDIEEVDAEKVFSKMLLAGLSKQKHGLLYKIADRLRKKTVVADLISIPVFTFIPSLGRARSSLRSYGIKLGVDLDSGEEVYWNLGEVTSPHVLVVGPSGIGKTTFLAGLALSLNKAGLGVLVIDPKNEYKKIFESRGEEVAHFTLGRNVSIGFVELLKAVRNSLDRDLVEILLDIMTSHRELNKRDVFSCLHIALSNLTTIPEGGDIELINSLKRFSRYCSEEYSEYVISKVLSVLAAVSGSSRGLFSLLKELNGLNVLDVSPILTIDPSLMPLLLKVILVAMKTAPTSYPMRTDYHRVIVVDEAWTVLKEGSLGLLEELIRVGRSFGTVVALATQTARDFTKTLGPLIDNLGLLVVLPSTSAEYWEEVSRLFKVSSERIEKARALGRGYAIVRMAPDPRALLIKLDR